MWVLLKNREPNNIKPWHVEPEERYRRMPPLNPNWELVGTFETFELAVRKAAGVSDAQMLGGNGKRNVTPSIRYEVLKRDGYRCQACGASAKDGARLEVDHRVPIAKGGSNHLSNLWVLCDKCNRGKGAHLA